MDQRYHVHYQTLGINPGDSWQRVRAAYKKRMRIWHPDRYADSDNRKREAEERSKTLNRAYKELAEYYRLNGRLPLVQPAPLTPTSEYGTTPVPPASSAPTRNESASTTTPEHTPLRRKFNLAHVAPVLFLGLALAALYSFRPNTEHVNEPTSPRQQTPNSAADQARQVGTSDIAESPVAPLDTRSFTVGSTLGEVYSIQGIPTQAETNVWHYGDAVVHFRNGRVEKWEDPSGQTLKAQTVVTSDQTTPRFIHLGSTKSEVLSIQGEPTRTTDVIWDYGTSRIRFENGRVAGWYESPLNPLRLRR